MRIRQRGERDLDQVPLTELAAVVDRESATLGEGSPESVARAVMAAYAVKRLTDSVESRIRRAVDIAKRERAKKAAIDQEWARVHCAIAKIPAGRWTALQDLAELADTSPGWVGRHLYGKWDLTGLHRVLEPDGRPWRWFQWPAGTDREDALTLLRQEGSVPAEGPSASVSLRLNVEDLRKLVDPVAVA